MNGEGGLLRSCDGGLRARDAPFHQTNAGYTEQAAFAQRGWPEHSDAVVQDGGKQRVAVPQYQHLFVRQQRHRGEPSFQAHQPVLHFLECFLGSSAHRRRSWRQAYLADHGVLQRGPRFHDSAKPDHIHARPGLQLRGLTGLHIQAAGFVLQIESLVANGGRHDALHVHAMAGSSAKGESLDAGDFTNRNREILLRSGLQNFEIFGTGSTENQSGELIVVVEERGTNTLHSNFRAHQLLRLAVIVHDFHNEPIPFHNQVQAQMAAVAFVRRDFNRRAHGPFHL